jgi:superfamily II DNA or RNA helicase
MIEQARELLRTGKKRIVIHAATGSGKTIVAAAIVSAALEKNKKVLFLVHYRELAYQALNRFTEFGIGNDVGIIMAGEESHLDKPIQIASVQTYARRLDFQEAAYNPWFHNADLVIYDECHASIARTRKAILDLYKKDTPIIGLTATPCRADGRGLGEVYEDIVSCCGVAELTTLNHLVPVIYYGCKELPDLKNIPIVAGDYNKKILGERVVVPKLIGDIYDNWARIAIDRQTVIFAVNVKHSKYIKDLFERRGVSIAHVDAHSPEEERRDILDRFKAGEIQVVTNVGVYSEGADFPWASCIVLARPSKSYGRYVQMAGRGLRPYPGKENCIIIDHAGLVNVHRFLDEEVVWSLDGKEKAWKKKSKKKEPKIFECEMCMTMHTGRRCPQCGWEIQDYGKKVEAYEAELEQLGKNKKPIVFTQQEKQQWWRMFLFERDRLKKTDRWLLAQYKSKFGVWPRNMDNLTPLEPDHIVKNWLTSQRIRYFKRKEKEEKESCSTLTESNPKAGDAGTEFITNLGLMSEQGNTSPAPCVGGKIDSGSQIKMEQENIFATSAGMGTGST